jgi:hypothetical protein
MNLGVARRVAAGAAVFGCAAIPAPLLHQALAAAAGTLFEAAPFVLAVTLWRGPLARRSAALFGCGCGAAAGPAALSLPAAGLCWATFGPVVALARFGAAALLHARSGTHAGRQRNDAESRDDPDPLEQLGAIALPAFGLALATAIVQSAHPGPTLGRAPAVLVAILEGVAGLVAGTFAPCCTAAVALAAMLRVTAPFASAGILVTAGLVPARRPAPYRIARYDGRFGIALLGFGCAALALHGGSGFVHPRLVPLLWAAAPGAFIAARARKATSARFGALVPAAMLAALVLGSPPPDSPIGSETLDGLYAGEPVAFTGVAATINGRTTLVRYAITCCRADASAVTLPTNLHLRLPRDTWLAFRGTIARDESGFYARATAWRRVQPPADPYLYR